MYRFTAKLADLTVSIETKHDYTVRLFSDYTVDADDFDIDVPYSETGLAKECENDPDASERYHESLYVYRKICEKMLDYEAMLLHSSAVCLDGEAYLFTAPSGTGKSTHTRLWRECFGERAFMINDDKPIIRHKDGVFTVYGTPYDGQHHLSRNTSAPIKAICVIERAKENTIRRLNNAEAISALLAQTLLPADEGKMDKLLSLIERLFEAVPVYKLGCNISADAVKTAYENMKN